MRRLVAAMGLPESVLAAPDWFHVFKSYDGQRYGVCDTRTGLPSSGRRFNSTHKDRGYTQDEAYALADWLNDRERGYAKLRQFEGGALWPVGDISGYIRSTI